MALEELAGVSVPEEDTEVEFSDDQLNDHEKQIALARRTLALEVASGLGHLFSDAEGFWKFVDDVERYLS
jgi:hypothetical protein